MKLIIMMALVGLVVSGPAKAEPGPVMNYLIKTPASMMDVGMLKLNRLLQSRDQMFRKKKVSLYAKYNWKINRLEIFGYQYMLKFNKELCTEIITAIRQRGAVSGGKAKIGGSSFFANEFTHAGYELKSEPKDYLHKIDEIIEISVELDGGHCKGPLLSEDVYIKEDD